MMAASFSLEKTSRTCLTETSPCMARTIAPRATRAASPLG